MLDDAVSVFVKARNELLLSIIDANDIDDSVGEYLFAKNNLKTSNFEPDITWRERICDSFVKSEIGGILKGGHGAEVFISDAERRRQVAEQSNHHLSERQPWRKRVKSRGSDPTSHAHDIEVNPNGLAPYGTSDDHPFSSIYDPSKVMNSGTGRTARLDTIIQQVLPTHTKDVTHAKAVETLERMQDRIMRKEKSLHHTGMLKEDGDIFYHGIGPLDGIKGSDVTSIRGAYDRDFERWLAGDDDWRSINSETEDLDHDGNWRSNAIARVKAMGLSTDIQSGHDHSEEELELRKLHADDRARSWMSDAVDLEKKSEKVAEGDSTPEQAYAHWQSTPEGVSFEEAEKQSIIEHGHNLGELSWIHQLQWFSPKERSAILEAAFDGLDKASNQDIKLPDGTTVSAGRLKRSFHHVMGGLADWGGRTAGFTNSNAIPRRESNDELSAYEQDMLFDSLHDIVHSDGLSDEIQDNLREALGGLDLGEDEDGNKHHFDTDGKKHRVFRNLPEIKEKKDSEGMVISPAEQLSGSDNPIGDIIDSGYQDKRLQKSSIMLALGYDPETGAAIPAGEHPYYPAEHHSGPLISEENMASMLKRAKIHRIIASQGKELRNQQTLHTSPLWFDESEATDEELAMMQGWGIEDGGHYTPAALFAQLYSSGLSRNPHTLIEMLHDHSSDGDGNSYIGSTDGSRITVNENNIGLWGPYIAARHDLFNTPHAVLSRFNNSKNPENQDASNPKNQILAGLSSLFPGVVNAISGLSMSQIKAKYDKEFDITHPRYSSRQHNVKTPHGKGINWNIKKPIDIAGAGITAEFGRTVEVPLELTQQQPLGARQKENRTPDMIARDQSLMSHTINSMMGRGERGRPSSIMRMTPASLATRQATFGARPEGLDVTEGSAAESFLLDSKALRETVKETKLGGPLAREKGGGKTIQEKKLGKGHEGRLYDDLQNMIESHYNAILTVVGHLAPMYPEDTFTSSNPNLNIDIDKIFQLANRALKHLPAEYIRDLGITVSGYGIDEDKLPLHQTGFGNFHNHMDEHGFRVTRETDFEDLMDYLKYPQDGAHRAHATNMLTSIQSGLKNDDDHRTVMSMEHLIRSNPQLSTEKGDNFFDKYQDVENVLDHVQKLRRAPNLNHLSDEEFFNTYGFERNVKDGDGEVLFHGGSPVKGWQKPMKDMRKAILGFQTNVRRQFGKEGLATLGITPMSAPTIDDKGKHSMLVKDGDGDIHIQGRHSNRNFRVSGRNIEHQMKNVFIQDPNVDLSSLPKDITTETIRDGPGREIHPMGTTGTPIMDLFDKTGLLEYSNYRRGVPTHSMDFGTGKPVLGPHTQEEAFSPAPMDAISSLWDLDVANTVQMQDEAMTWERGANQFTPYEDPLVGSMIPAEVKESGTWSEPSDYAAYLLNPDSLLMKGDSPSWVPPIRPMHRIFSFKDLQRLRGFTGTWVVSKWYDGERIVVTKKGDEINGYDEGGGRRSIPDWAKNGVKNLGEKDCTLDGILDKKELHVIDITFYDDTDVTDMSVQERLKILRGQFDSYEQVTIPGPHDTKLTDEEGLEDLVNNFLDEHKTLLLRDGKSTYMKGERRHPKWVLLRPNKSINLKILDKRGKKPFTYRLGAGPLIDDDGIEDKTVEFENDIYLDVGTVSSPKPFEEGDIVEVKVSGIKHQEIDGRDVYSLTPMKLIGEGEGESSVSMETLGMLSKSLKHLHFPHDVKVVDDKVVVFIPYQDEVSYTLEKSHGGFWVHSPDTILSDMGGGNYSIMLSESLKPFWGQVVSMLLKGKIERVDDPIPSEDSQEDIEEDSEELDDEDLLLKPKMEEGLTLIERALDLLEKNQFGFTGGAKGLGIDVGSLTESPRGPTHLEGEESMPDWDMIARPTEDSEKEYPHIKRQRRKRKGLQYSDSDEKDDPKT